MSTLPSTFTVNAIMREDSGGIVRGAVAGDARPWALRGRIGYEAFLRPEPEADLKNWRDPRVGWGLIVAETPGMNPVVLQTNADLPQPIRDLVTARNNAPVFRFRRDGSDPYNLLRDYRAGKDVTVSGSPRGTAPGAMPYYLLIYGAPAQVPWGLQYVLNNTHCVGRLDLEGDALQNYVAALMNNWAGSAAKNSNVVIWATDHSPADITHLMRDAVARPISEAMSHDTDLKTTYIAGQAATGAALIQGLAAQSPGLIVTTSHGMTGPLDTPLELTANLGLPVDSGFRKLDPAALLQAWNPAGAIWYSHACCSAGSDARSLFQGLLDPNSDPARVLNGVAASAGARVAPLPRTLLGAMQPARAFIGHIEPTFDWTLTQPLTGQYLTAPIRDALYNKLYNGFPLGHAFRDWFQRVGELSSLQLQRLQEYNAGGDVADQLLYYQLSSRDIGAMVIIGDPTVTLDLLH